MDREHGIKRGDYSMFYRFLGSNDINTLRSNCANKVLVDLGCGLHPDVMARFALGVLGVYEYVGVEYKGVPIIRDPKIDTSCVTLVRADMMGYLNGLDSGRVNLTLNGIDQASYVDRTKSGGYDACGTFERVSLVHRLSEVCLPGGVVFGINSPLIDGLIGYQDFKQIPMEIGNDYVSVFGRV